MKKIVIIVVITLLIILVGLNGNLDQDEYIEVNLTPKPQIWRGN